MSHAFSPAAGGHRRRAGRLTAAVLLIALLVALAAAAEASAAPLRWRDCGERGLQCTSLRVPLNYAKPRGAQITIGLNRLRALDRKRRVGSLIYNPGGPGGAATRPLELAAMGRPYFTADTRNRFDIVGMDPRGVGSSTRLKCSAAIFNRPVSLFPTSAAGFSRLVAQNRRLGASCVRRSGRLLRYLDARYVARDMERVRRALRDGKLNFLGLSYGTLIGLEYANLYPRRIRTMALDGLLNHDVPELEAMSDEGAAYERALNRFFAWCDATPGCALYGKGAQATWTRVMAKATAAPIPAPGCSAAPTPCRTTVAAEDIRFNMQDQLFIKDPVPGLLPGWYGLAEALAAADAGDATALSTPLATGPSDLGIAGLVIACLEFAGHTTSWPQQFTKQVSRPRHCTPAARREPDVDRAEQVHRLARPDDEPTACASGSRHPADPACQLDLRSLGLLRLGGRVRPSGPRRRPADPSGRRPYVVFQGRADARRDDALSHHPSHPAPQHGLRGLTRRGFLAANDALWRSG